MAQRDNMLLGNSVTKTYVDIHHK